MIFAVFWLQCFSLVFGTTTKTYDIETVINSYLSNTIDQHALHATSQDYMEMIQQESNLTPRYLQSVRYILHGFPNTIANETIYTKLNFIQSIALFYCGINMSQVMNISFENISIDESQLYTNSSIFPVQIVESYELVRSEICERIKLGLHQSVVDMFDRRKNTDPFFPDFIQHVASFISSTPRKINKISMWEHVAQLYPFLSRFGEYELYKERVIQEIWKIDSFGIYRDESLLKNKFDVRTCVSEIQYPKMHKYVSEILKQQVELTGNESFILNHRNVSITDFQYYISMYRLNTNNAPINRQLENNTVKMPDLMQLLDESKRNAGILMSMTECALIVFRIYESCDAHEYVVNAIKCIISKHDLYCSKFIPLAIGSDNHDDLRKSFTRDLLYPYLNDIMNDTVFVNIVNNISIYTDSKTNSYLQTILPRLMLLALNEYKDIDMIKKIATVFKPTINVCANCFRVVKKLYLSASSISWMDVLMKDECMYLTNYFQQRFRRQIIENCTQLQTSLLR